ncbi:hypothetical protein ACFSHP_07045 [Novosphingobium panipatense]
MSRTSAYLLRRRDAAFAAGWEAALVLARRHVEEVLATRALDGVEEAVWFRGELVGSRRRYDTRLLLAHLARLDRVAEETADHAGRFDEALALVAGSGRLWMTMTMERLAASGRVPCRSGARRMWRRGIALSSRRTRRGSTR